MKYYIPTTTLNFNNILSSESISPKVFFQQRGFGYSRWFSIPENNLNNSIVLYNSLSGIERNNSEMEDHPLIIEIDSEESFQEIKQGVFLTDKTIYLNPWNTKFIFLSEQDKKVALSLSDSSLETKMIDLYHKRFFISSPQGRYIPIEKEQSEKINESGISHDRVINRLKGLMYGFYIGASLNCDQADVDLYTLLQELQNIFAAILSHPLRKPSEEQKRRVRMLINSYLHLHPLFREIETSIGKGDFIETCALINKYRNNLPHVNPSHFFIQLREGDVENNPALAWVKDELQKLNSLSHSNRKFLSPEESEIVVAENQLRSIADSVISNPDEKVLFTGIVNKILNDASISGKMSSQRKELADRLTLIAKEILNKQWETSPIRTYLNSLRRHISGKEFDQEWNNGVLSSLAAVLLKGDDWEVLLDFMKRKGMTNYKLAFAFYGLFNGFANLTRDFTDLLFRSERKYVADVYTHIHRCLHSISSNSTPHELRTYLPIDDPCSDSLHVKIYDFFKTNISKPRRTKKQLNLDNELKFTLNLLRECEDTYIFVCVLNDCLTWGSGEEWKKIKNNFCPDYQIIRDTKISYDIDMGIPDHPLLQSIWTFFRDHLYPVAKKEIKLQMVAELKFVLNRIQKCANPYTFVCVLNDSKLWESTSLEWQKMQQVFCPDYESIRKNHIDDINNSENNNSTNKISVKQTQKEDIGGLFSMKEGPVPSQVFPGKKNLSILNSLNSNYNGNQQNLNKTTSNTTRTSGFSPENNHVFGKKKDALKDKLVVNSSDAFVYDELCWKEIENLIPYQHKSEFKKDLDWFQNEYKKGEQSRYYKEKPRDIEKVIVHFKNYISGKSCAKDLKIDTITDFLINRYAR